MNVHLRARASKIDPGVCVSEKCVGRKMSPWLGWLAGIYMWGYAEGSKEATCLNQLVMLGVLATQMFLLRLLVSRF
jgi:hypothetical protein